MNLNKKEFKLILVFLKLIIVLWLLKKNLMLTWHYLNAK